MLDGITMNDIFDKCPALNALRQDNTENGIANNPHVLRSSILELARIINRQQEKINELQDKTKHIYPAVR